MTNAHRAELAPGVGLIHHLACSGGTIISRAIAAMDGVVLLSEQHPEQAMGRRTDPFKQAQAAGASISDEDVAGRFVRDIAFIADRCARDGRRLVVRDHANRDFLGTDQCRLMTCEVLSAAMPTRSVCTVRHPLDTWLALQANGWFKRGVGEFLHRYEAFARCAAEIGFVRYEDFVVDPDAALARVCDATGAVFDGRWRDRIASVSHMTGASGRSSLTIAPRARRGTGRETLDAFAQDPACERALTLLGYSSEIEQEAA